MAVVVAAAVSAAVIACGAEGAPGVRLDEELAGGGDAPDAGPRGPGLDTDPRVAERPWEVLSRRGETYLANVFYADASENEQVMPYAIRGHVQIDRLVYPTLGNPNLYVKDDPDDELVVVLRIEESAFDFLAPSFAPVANSPLSRVELAKASPDDGIVFWLVPRARRGEATAKGSSVRGDGLFPVRPTAVYQSPMPPDLPARLAGRRTWRFVFDQAAMRDVPAGLYDLRFEVRKGGALHRNIHEYQYNAVRVFDAEPEEYDVVNVTDTQVSVGSTYAGYTKTRLDELVDHLARSPEATRAAFMTFNGDLHNGGSPGALRQRDVAHVYADEAAATLDSLVKLPIPVFLTAGNHDGYVSIGHVPSAVRSADAATGDDLKKIVGETAPLAWPGFTWDAYQAYLDATSEADALGGFHRDLFVGAFRREAKATTFAEGWKEVPVERRNIVLYDGFHQWQKTYGPLYASWRFGKNRYVSLNSYELRQHRRAGWGMYTVNYGGGMSDVQMAWLDRELVRAEKEASDVVVLAHHDPRGGHQGEDHGYYFEQLEFRGVSQSAINFLWHTVWNPAVCNAPAWALPRSQEESCVHDGLQEWMRPDEELDCTPAERIPTESGEDLCERALFDPGRGKDTHTYWWSGLELLRRLAQNPQVRTLLLGHTHYNELEVLRTGDVLLPSVPLIGAADPTRAAFREIENPIRGFAIQNETNGAREDYDPDAIPFAELRARSRRATDLLELALARTPRLLEAALDSSRELVILRTMSNADLGEQTWQGRSALGFAVLHVTRHGGARPQVNRATFFVNVGGAFDVAADVAIDREIRLPARDPGNPLAQAFRF